MINVRRFPAQLKRVCACRSSSPTLKVATYYYYYYYYVHHARTTTGIGNFAPEIPLILPTGFMADPPW